MLACFWIESLHSFESKSVGGRAGGHACTKEKGEGSEFSLLLRRKKRLFHGGALCWFRHRRDWFLFWLLFWRRRNLFLIGQAFHVTGQLFGRHHGNTLLLVDL